MMAQGMMNQVEDAAFRLVEVDEDHAKATAFNMLFLIWRRRTLAAPYRRAIRLVHELGSQYPEGVGVFQMVEVDAAPPDPQARGAFVDSLKLRDIKHLSVTHDGVGFKAAAVRAIMTGITALARPQFKLAVLSSVVEAAGWHAAAQIGLGRSESASTVEGIIRRLREIHRDRYP